MITEAISRSKTKEELKEALDSFGAQDLLLYEEQYVSQTDPPAKKKMFNGVVSFQDIGRIIGRRWRSINKKSLDRYNALADADNTRYRAEMEKYYQDCSRKEELQANSSPQETNSTSKGMSSIDHRRKPYGSSEYQQENLSSTTRSSSIVVNPTREELLRISVIENLHPAVLNKANAIQAHEIPSLLNSELSLSTLMRRTQPNLPHFELGGLSNLASSHVSPLGGNVYLNLSNDDFGFWSNNDYNTSQSLVENAAIFQPRQQPLVSELIASLQGYGSQLFGHVALNYSLGRGDLPLSQKLLNLPTLVAPQYS